MPRIFPINLFSSIIIHPSSSWQFFWSPKLLPTLAITLFISYSFPFICLPNSSNIRFFILFLSIIFLFFLHVLIIPFYSYCYMVTFHHFSINDTCTNKLPYAFSIYTQIVQCKLILLCKPRSFTQTFSSSSYHFHSHSHPLPIYVHSYQFQS